ncbi:hypothetical protein BDF19DRAFT_443707 [Syncephalis fuscata]|nr:hypothetical protein BDF19DRAFT_443707 [Syncephalis fuscata]
MKIYFTFVSIFAAVLTIGMAMVDARPYPESNENFGVDATPKDVLGNHITNESGNLKSENIRILLITYLIIN